MNDLSTCDRCDIKLTKPDFSNFQSLTDRQRRFLDAYCENGPSIAPAARLAGVHRATVYRWLEANAEFQAAQKLAVELFYRVHLAKVRAAQAARQLWREEREAARRDMRCENLARARGAKHWKWMNSTN